MHSSAKLQFPPLSVLFLCSCEKVYHKQEVHFLLVRLLLDNISISIIHSIKIEHVLL